MHNYCAIRKTQRMKTPVKPADTSWCRRADDNRSASQHGQAGCHSCTKLSRLPSCSNKPPLRANRAQCPVSPSLWMASRKLQRSMIPAAQRHHSITLSSHDQNPNCRQKSISFVDIRQSQSIHNTFKKQEQKTWTKQICFHITSP